MLLKLFTHIYQEKTNNQYVPQGKRNDLLDKKKNMFSQTVFHTNKAIGAVVILYQKLKQEN